jgi:phage shock protein A
MGTFSRLRYVIAANVNALIEKAEDPEKLLRALIREMEDASEEARLASADLLAEQQRLERLEMQLSKETEQWQRRAENAVSQDRDDLARAALKAKAEISDRHQIAVEEQQHIAERVNQMEQDMVTLKSKLAESKIKLKSMQAGKKPRQVNAEADDRTSPGERKVRRAMDRFDRLQSQVENLEARVRSYEVGGSSPSVWTAGETEAADPEIEEELAQLKARVAKPEEADTSVEEA